MTCSDFCTAAKCEELEARLAQLESNFELLQILFQSHQLQPIPIAHQYEPLVVVDAVINQNKQTTENELKVDVTIDNINAFGSAILPKNNIDFIDIKALDTGQNNLSLELYVNDLVASTHIQFIEPQINLDVFDLDANNFGISMTVGTQHAQDNFTVTLPEQEINLDVFELQPNDFEISMSVGTQHAQDNFTVNLPEQESDIRISSSYHNDYLTLTVADGNSFDSTQVFIDATNNFFGGEQMECDLSPVLAAIDAARNQIVTDTREIKKISKKNYQILGGDNWKSAENGTLSLPVKPENLIKTVGNKLYSEGSNDLTELTVTNLLELFTAFSTVDFYRSGHHRLPIAGLNSLLHTEEGNKTITIYDSLSFQEWTIKQLDGLIGEFPLKIKHKTVNGNEINESEMILQNISEAIAEFMALTLNIAQDSDTAINIGMKSLVESMKASNAAISTYDYAVANAQYLGYKGNDVEREVAVSFTPGADNLVDALKPSTKKIVGWENQDSETLVEVIKRVLIGTEIVKAALFHPFTPGDKLTGDAIKENREQQKTENENIWEQFKQQVNNPTGRYQVPKPKAQIKDLTVDTPEL